MRFPHAAGDYDLLEQIGQGAFGAVYRVRERATGRTLALKVLGKVQGEGPRRRFEREGEALARLDHPGIVRVHSATWTGDHPHLALELVEGQDLEQRLEREGAFAPEAARALLQPLAEAVAHAHARGVLHRDIKPSNVIVSASDARPMLLDFGLASLAESERLTLSGQMLGTPSYMAPEQARGRWDERTDVYGLGALLYACLTGSPPVHGDSLAECLVQVMSGPAPDPRQLSPEVPPALAQLCRRCLAKEPDERFQSAHELASALASVDLRARQAPLGLLIGAGLLSLVALAFLIGALASEPEPSLAATPQPQASAQASAQPSAQPSAPGLAASQTAAAAPAAPLSEREWEALLLGNGAWQGTLDLDAIRARAAPEHAGRVGALGALGDLAGQIHRGAPWRELSVTLARLGEVPWPQLQAMLGQTRARLLLERGRWGQALESIRGQRGAGAEWLRFEVLIQRQETADLLPILQRLARGSGPVAGMARSRMARAQGDHQAALRAARTSLVYPHARLEVAMAHFALGEREAGRRALENFLEIWGPTPVALNLATELALSERDPERALALVQRAVALVEVDPDPSLTYMHARVLLALRRPADAQALIEPVLPEPRADQALALKDVRLLTILGVAYYDLPATRARAGEAWARAARGLGGIAAPASFPPEGSQAAFTEFQRVVLAASGAPSTSNSSLEDFTQALERLQGGLPTKLSPLGQLPQELAAQLAPPTGDAPQALLDVLSARRKAAEGRPWSELRFFLVRALEAETHPDQVRAAWLQAALGRERALEQVAERLEGGELMRYGLTEPSAALSRADVAWGRKQTGRAARLYAALRGGEPETEVGRVAGASLSVLQGRFDLVEAQLEGLKSPALQARAEALRGLAQLGQGRLEAAAKSERRAYACAGAADCRTLALRAAIGAGLPGILTSPPEQQLELAGWQARSLALRACLASGEEAKVSWALNSLLSKKDEGAEALLLIGYGVLLRRDQVSRARARVEAAWRTARTKDPALPIPESWVEAFTKAYGAPPPLGR